MPKSEALKREPDEHTARTEMLFQQALNDLKTNHDTDVNFEDLFALVNMYHNFYYIDEIVEKRWLAYTEEILELLAQTEHETEAELKQLMDTDRPMKAYQKAIDTANNEE